MGGCRKYRRALRVESQDLVQTISVRGWLYSQKETDLHPNAGSPSALNLMFMSEQCNTSPPSSIIECTFIKVRNGETVLRMEEHTAGKDTKRC